MQDLKVLGLQYSLEWEDPEKNRSRFKEIIEESFDGHDLIVLPETFTTGFPVDPALHSEKIDGETMLWMSNLAKSLNTTITGSFLLDSSSFFSNSLIWMSPDGSFKRYDKRHVFSMGGENEKIKAGQEQLIVELKGWKIKPMICYDLRFPVWGRNFSDGKNYEYDMAIFVANWPAVRSYPWRQLLIARAIENMACVVGINRVGMDGLGNKYSGDSLLLDAKGNILAYAKNAEECAITTIFSAKELQSFRKKFNVGLDWDEFEIK
jgi:predicted amidohydrolase